MAGDGDGDRAVGRDVSFDIGAQVGQDFGGRVVGDGYGGGAHERRHWGILVWERGSREEGKD